MANLSISKLDEAVYELLQLRATKRGVSMEEEAGRIISQVVSAPDCIADVFQKHFGVKHGVDLGLHSRKPHDSLDLRAYHKKKHR